MRKNFQAKHFSLANQFNNKYQQHKDLTYKSGLLFLIRYKLIRFTLDFYLRNPRKHFLREIKTSLAGCFSGGESGIRTREPLRVTRFPSVRAKPDYAISPI